MYGEKDQWEPKTIKTNGPLHVKKVSVMPSLCLVLSVRHKSPGVVTNVQAIRHCILVEFAVDEVFEFHPIRC